MDRALSTLSDQGYRLVEWTPPHLDRAPEVWLTAMAAADGNRFIDSLGDHKPVSLRRQWAKWTVRRSDHILPCLLLATFEKLVRRRNQPDAPLRLALQEAIEGRLGDDGVLLFPPFSRRLHVRPVHANGPEPICERTLGAGCIEQRYPHRPAGGDRIGIHDTIVQRVGRRDTDIVAENQS